MAVPNAWKAATWKIWEDAGGRWRWTAYDREGTRIAGCAQSWEAPNGALLNLRLLRVPESMIDRSEAITAGWPETVL